MGNCNSEASAWSKPGHVGSGLSSNDWSHAADAADNLTILRGFAHSGNTDDQLLTDAQSGANAYVYDLDGDPTTYRGATATYDTEGHLSSYFDPLTNQTVSFGYRPDG